jgi:hypothetical protein
MVFGYLANSDFKLNFWTYSFNFFLEREPQPFRTSRNYSKTEYRNTRMCIHASKVFEFTIHLSSGFIYPPTTQSCCCAQASLHKEAWGKVKLHEFLNSPPHGGVWWLQTLLVLTPRKCLSITRAGLDVGAKREAAYFRSTWVSGAHVSNRP